MKYLFSEVIVTFLLLFSISSCEKENNKKEDNYELLSAEGYIVGFRPCTINQHYRIGFIIITSDLKDTLATYNISDSTYKMPANVFLNKTDTLYKIPWNYFQNYVNSAYFPEASRYEFKIYLTYKIAKEEEKVYNVCTADINASQFNKAIQIIVYSAKKQSD